MANLIPSDLSALRAEIESIDRELLSLLSRRFECSRAVGDYKREHDLPFFDLGREQALLSSYELALFDKEEWLKSTVLDAFRMIIARSREVQSPLHLLFFLDPNGPDIIARRNIRSSQDPSLGLLESGYDDEKYTRKVLLLLGPWVHLDYTDDIALAQKELESKRGIKVDAILSLQPLNDDSLPLGPFFVSPPGQPQG